MVVNKSRAIAQLKAILQKWKYPIGENLEKLFDYQERRYIKLIS
jgi:hypothetical protein